MILESVFRFFFTLEIFYLSCIKKVKNTSKNHYQTHRYLIDVFLLRLIFMIKAFKKHFY